MLRVKPVLYGVPSLQGWLLALPTNIRLLRKGLLGTNNLAYFAHWYVANKKSFITMVPGKSSGKLSGNPYLAMNLSIGWRASSRLVSLSKNWHCTFCGNSIYSYIKNLLTLVNELGSSLQKYFWRKIGVIVFLAGNVC